MRMNSRGSQITQALRPTPDLAKKEPPACQIAFHTPLGRKAALDEMRFLLRNRETQKRIR